VVLAGVAVGAGLIAGTSEGGQAALPVELLAG